jgi:hypothetical protein
MISQHRNSAGSAVPLKKDKKQKWLRADIISTCALAVSTIALVISILAEWTPGTVRPLKPSGYGIIREVGSFPSDHIVLSLEWQNTSSDPILVRHPYLLLRELGPDGEETGNELRFVLAGEYPDISTDSFKERYSIQTSFAVDTRSISVKVLVFHIDRWWDETDPLYQFRFADGQKYDVYIGFQRDLDEQPETLLFKMPLHRNADRLDRSTNLWWDYWTIE